MKEEDVYGPRGAFACPTGSAGHVHSAFPVTACVLRSAYRTEDEVAADVDVELMRKYERERLRYYYAIVECDSSATAASLYELCDGLV